MAVIKAGAHIFVEKPLETAVRSNREVVTGYILRHHPSRVELTSQTTARPTVRNDEPEPAGQRQRLVYP